MRPARFAAVLMASAALALPLSLGACATTADMGGEPVAFEAQRLSDHIRTMSDDRFEGRGIGQDEAGEQLTVAYLIEQFSNAGLAPGGENGGWTQTVTLNRFEASDIEASLSVGDWTLPVTQGEQVAISTRLPGEAVNLEDAELVFVGYGVTAPERQWDDFKDMDVRGKILVVLVNDPDFEQPELGTFGGRAMTYYGRWSYKYEEAARRGAAGVLVVHETAPASYGWATVRNSWSGPQFDIVRQNAADERIPVEAWIQRDVAVDLFRRAGQDFEALKLAARSRDFQPVALDGASMDVSFDVATSTIQTDNVIGVLRGTTHPDETILYGGHWDHIGMGEPDASGDGIFNGAVDNASGMAAIIEIARRFGAGPQPERSVVFMGFTAEESGLLGAEYYAANPLYPLETMVAGVNIDSANVYGRTTDMAVTGHGQSALDDYVETAAAELNRTVTPDPRPEAGGYFRSDHFPFVKRGVPMIYAGGGTTFRDEPVQPRIDARAEYGRTRYHQAADEWSPDFDYAGMIEDMEIWYEVGARLANSRDWPEWRPTSEFITVRAESADARQ
ncbi:MAG: Zn-dependent M28 family amino/carboxypeptidase [Brevundimonas sp.]|jgi:Zn-dependent M28 family amino/carboxypeptidase|uniref:M28 family metallopeptidase n=1 Tax=Brevundimonas sp. TaxID=1871086 RepID=UPI0039E5F7AC